ncbi:TatD related DNase [Gracilaria domingensis]|nr:TatD related DNase [Gracilaria domingensis]
MMIDTHAHLTDPQFSADLEDVISRAQSAGVGHIICVSESLADAKQVLKVSRQHASVVHPALGLHPEHVTTLTEAALQDELQGVTELVQAPVVAIGEVGLDFSPHVLSQAPNAEEAKHNQRSTFGRFLQLAQQTGLPLTVHSRSAGHHALTQICDANAEAPLTAIMHAFDGRAVHAVNALKRMPERLYFSIPPSIARSNSKVKLVRQVPLERLLLESDAPALAAVAQQRNEPAQLVKVVDMIAGVRGERADNIRQQLWHNSMQVFPLFESTAITSKT